MAKAAANQIDPKFITGQLETTAETANAFKKGLQQTIAQVDKGFKSTMLMFQAAFYLGIALVVAAMIYGMCGGRPLISTVFGGVGSLELLVFFLTKPPLYLQASRSNLAQLQAAYFNWFLDISNWNSLLGALANQGPLQFDQVREISEAVFRSTDQTMSLISQYCGLRAMSGHGLPSAAPGNDGNSKALNKAEITAAPSTQ